MKMIAWESKWLRQLLAATLAAAVAAASATETTIATSAQNVDVARPLPLEYFARLPLVQGVTLSPDGQRFAALVNVGGDTVLGVRELAGREITALVKTDNKQYRIGWVRWANNERLLLSVSYPGRRGWVEVAETRLLSIHRDGGEFVNLVRRPTFDTSNQVAQFQDEVIDWCPTTVATCCCS